MLFFLSAALLAQAPDTLPDRIEKCRLSAEARAEVHSALEAKDYARAASLLERQSVMAGKSAAAAELIALAGAIDFLAGSMDRAAGDFRQADALVSLDDRDRFTWAMALIKLNDANTARNQLALLNASHPDTPLYLYWLARIDYDQRLYSAAVEKLRRVVHLDPESSRGYDNLGLAFDMLGQTADAETAFRKAVELNRKLLTPSAWPPHNLGNLLLRAQQLSDAGFFIRESLRYDATLTIAHYHLGRVLEAQGHDDEAISEYRLASTSEPVVVESLYSLGLVYRRHNRASEAEAAFAEYKSRKSESTAVTSAPDR